MTQRRKRQLAFFFSQRKFPALNNSSWHRRRRGSYILIAGLRELAPIPEKIKLSEASTLLILKRRRRSKEPMYRGSGIYQRLTLRQVPQCLGQRRGRYLLPYTLSTTTERHLQLLRTVFLGILLPIPNPLRMSSSGSYQTILRIYFQVTHRMVQTESIRMDQMIFNGWLQWLGITPPLYKVGGDLF
jgi:hypothetical protein